MPLISRKKGIYAVGGPLMEYLQQHGRVTALPIPFDALRQYNSSVAVYNKKGEDTLWETALYSPLDRDVINRGALHTYAALKLRGNVSLIEHLVTDRVDVCTWGNTQPFRVRILNTLNENFDYFYIKKADASRVYGLELEHLLSPNRIEFLCNGDTTVEEHIAGIPGHDFIASQLKNSHLDEVRLAKEFVKFNERCFVRLLGDMHAGNWVVDVTPDFDETSYRLRAIDFDQQSYERRCHVYLPQYYRQNNPIVFLGMRCMTVLTYRQYKKEERTLIAARARAEKARLHSLLRVMALDNIAPIEHVRQLRSELADHYDDQRFLGCESMGGLVSRSLDMLGVHEHGAL